VSKQIGSILYIHGHIYFYNCFIYELSYLYEKDILAWVSSSYLFLHVTQISEILSQMGLSKSPSATGPHNQPQTCRELKIPCKSPFNVSPFYATDGDAPDTIELIRQVSTNQNAVMAFYYTDASNQV
jgi:hypothetical protein